MTDKWRWKSRAADSHAASLQAATVSCDPRTRSVLLSFWMFLSTYFIHFSPPFSPRYKITLPFCTEPQSLPVAQFQKHVNSKNEDSSDSWTASREWGQTRKINLCKEVICVWKLVVRRGNQSHAKNIALFFFNVITKRFMLLTGSLVC